MNGIDYPACSSMICSGVHGQVSKAYESTIVQDSATDKYTHRPPEGVR